MPLKTTNHCVDELTQRLATLSNQLRIQRSRSIYYVSPAFRKIESEANDGDAVTTRICINSYIVLIKLSIYLSIRSDGGKIIWLEYAKLPTIRSVSPQYIERRYIPFEFDCLISVPNDLGIISSALHLRKRQAWGTRDILCIPLFSTHLLYRHISDLFFVFYSLIKNVEIQSSKQRGTFSSDRSFTLSKTDVWRVAWEPRLWPLDSNLWHSCLL